MYYINRLYILVPIIIIVLYMSSCSEDRKPAAINPIVVEEPAKELSAVEPYLPEAVGVKAFQRHCLTCHSSRYIEMQPNFPEKTWQKIVDKMVKNFGAPIPDSSVKVIVRYLVDIKGGKE